MEKKVEFSRRIFLKTSIVILGIAMVGLPRFSLGAEKLPKSIVSMSRGGVWGKTYKKVFTEPWTKKTGVEIIHFIGEAPEVMAKIKANLKNPAADLVFLPEFMIPDAVKWGILERLSLKTVPNLKDVPPMFHDRFDNYMVSNNHVLIGILYNKNKVKNLPKTWIEFVDRTIKGDFGRRVSFPSMSFQSSDSFCWPVAHELGASLEKMDAFFKKAKLMKPFVPKFFATATEGYNLIEAGEIDILPTWSHRAWTFIDSGHEDWDFLTLAPAVREGLTMGKVKHAHPIVFDFLNYMLSAEDQSRWADALNVVPVNSKARVNPKMQERYERTTPKGEALFPPTAEIAKVKDKWIERWNKEMGD